MEKSNLRGRSDAYVEERSTIQSNNDQIIPKGSIIDADAVINVTAFTNNEGRLKWNAPSGNWTILRIGHTAMGTLNKAAPDTGLGLECDKFNADAITFHFRKMMERILPVMDAVKNKMGLTIDSYEAGGQNWTAGFEERFRERAGYDIARYLPALAGGSHIKKRGPDRAISVGRSQNTSQPDVRKLLWSIYGIMPRAQIDFVHRAL
jgi:hypothetical protein